MAEFDLGAKEPGSIIKRADELAAKLSEAAEDGAGPLLASLLKRVDLVPGLLNAKVALGARIDRLGDQQDLVTSLDIPFTLHQNGKARPIIVRTAIGGRPQSRSQSTGWMSLAGTLSAKLQKSRGFLPERLRPPNHGGEWWATLERPPFP